MFLTFLGRSTKFVQTAATRAWGEAGKMTGISVGNKLAAIKLEAKRTAGDCKKSDSWWVAAEVAAVDFILVQLSGWTP